MRVSLFLLFLFSVAKLHAEEINVVVGLAKPPYVIQHSQTGFEIELITYVLNKMGKTPLFIFVPFGRSPKLLNNPAVDSILTINSQLIADTSLLTDTYIVYQNVVVTLKSNGYKVSKVEDLSGLSLAAFQSAHKVLGEKYAAVVRNQSSYVEVKNQKLQTRLLYEQKVDGLVMDINIFRTLSREVGGKPDYSDVDIHYVFPKSPYKVAFKNKELIEPFNSALHHFLISTEYRLLVDKYDLVQQPYSMNDLTQYTQATDTMKATEKDSKDNN